MVPLKEFGSRPEARAPACEAPNWSAAEARAQGAHARGSDHLPLNRPPELGTARQRPPRCRPPLGVDRQRHPRCRRPRPAWKRRRRGERVAAALSGHSPRRCHPRCRPARQPSRGPRRDQPRQPRSRPRRPRPRLHSYRSPWSTSSAAALDESRPCAWRSTRASVSSPTRARSASFSAPIRS